MFKRLTQNKRNAGFTLIELLVVIGILAVLLAIVLVAINPQRQFAQANNTKRQSDVSAILNAVGAYTADHAGLLPGTIVAPHGAGGTLDATNNMTNAAGGTDICTLLVPTYISALPSDPKVGTYVGCTTALGGYNLGYSISKDANNRVTVTATNTEILDTQPANIFVIR